MPSRRELIAMSDAEIDDYLASAQTLVIVSNGRDGFPHPMPMWFYRDADGAIYCTTFEKSQKVMNFRRDPKAALLVESGTAYAELKSVLIYADTKIVEEVDQVVDCLVNINAKGRELDEAGREKLRASVSGTAAKRVALKFIPREYVTWDHNKLGGKY